MQIKCLPRNGFYAKPRILDEHRRHLEASVHAGESLRAEGVSCAEFVGTHITDAARAIRR